MKKQKSQGFTLVELAIVIVVIGIVIGGILKGGEIIHNAKLSNTVKEINAVIAAINTFSQKYNQLPGDSNRATILIPNCNAANFCLDGDGNGLIAAPNTTFSFATYRRFSATVFEMETHQAWKHLALADLVTGVDTSLNLVPNINRQFGISHPVSAMGGGYEIYYDAIAATGFGGHLIRMSKSGRTPGPWEHNLTPGDAAMIDRKIDDGAPNTGLTRANITTQVNECKDRVAPGAPVQYLTNLADSLCTLFIQFRR